MIINLQDASPPTCNIYTNGSFILPPPQQPSQSASQYEVMPPLPSCFTADSREGLFHYKLLIDRKVLI